MNDLITVIFKHFDTYPLITHKWSDYQLFKSIVLILNNETNSLVPSGSLPEAGPARPGLERFIKILGYRYYLNLGISDELKNLYTNIIPVSRPVVPAYTINKDWLVGFIDGEGCFYINIVKSLSGYKIWLLFQLTQHIRDIVLLTNICVLLGCGTVNPRSVKGIGVNAADWEVTKFADLQTIIIPYLSDQLKSSKSEDFKLFCQASKIIEDKTARSWDADTILSLTALKEKMNKHL